MAAQDSEHNQETSHEAIERVNLRKTLFITEAGLRLRLNEVSIATALQYYHIFHLNMESPQEYDDHLVAMATLNLAAKAQDSSLRLSDLVNTCYRCLHKNSPTLDVCDLYWQLKDSVARMELVLLRALQFKLQMELPHKYLLHHLLALSNWVDTVKWEGSHVVIMSWSLLQDSFHTHLNLTHPPIVMATAVLYLAIHCCKLKIPSEGARKQWWEVLSPNVDEGTLQSISQTLMAVYTLKDNCIEPDESSSS